MGKSYASTSGSLIGLIMALAKLSMTGTIIWRLSNASLVPCVMVRPLTFLPQAFQKLQGQILKRPGGDREMAEILALVLHHDEQAVLCAVELALDAGVATKTHVLNILHRLSDANAPPAPPIDAPQALRLAQEPVANVERYDGLRNIGGLRHAS
jgi:hypothetical protein